MGVPRSFFPTRLPQVYRKDLLDLTVCKITHSDVGGGSSGICVIKAETRQVRSRSKMSGYSTYQAQGVHAPVQVFQVVADGAFGRAP